LAAPYSVRRGLYSEAVVSSVVSAAVLIDAGRFKEAVEYVQRAAKTLYEAARDVFEQVKVTAQRLVAFFVEAVTRVLAWIDEHKAYLFLMAAVASGVVALSDALNMWGIIKLEKLAYAAPLTPFFAGLADAGGEVDERFRALGEWYGRWKVDERLIDEVLRAPSAKDKRPYAAFLELFETRRNLPPPLVELRKALTGVKGGVEKDAAVIAALVFYKALVKNAEAYGKWAGWHKWARGLVEEREFTVAAGKIREIHKAHNGLRSAAGKVIEELNTLLTLYSQSGFYKEVDLKKLKQLLEVDLGEAEELAEARVKELSEFGGVNMGTKAHAALLSAARGGMYGHAAMLLMVEGALADIVISTPRGAYNKAKDVAKRRGGAVDPSRRGAAGWEDRAASVLLRFLIGYGEVDPRLLSGASEVNLKFRRVEKDDKKERVVKDVGRGFQVFRAYGGVEAPVGELWIGEMAYFTLREEELRRLVEVAKKTAPDLSGIGKIWQVLPWLSTDVSFTGGQIEGGTAHLWQLRWYLALFGVGKASGGRANVTEEGVKLYVKMRWRREVLDRIIAEESKELEPLLGRTVKSWRELVDAINWSQVLERVGELAGELKPWIGPKEVGDAEREELVRRMLGELALLVHFAEARWVMNDGRWREERATRLSKAVEALSGGRIAGEYADKLAQAVIYYAEGHKKYAEGLIESLIKELAGVSREEVWGVVEFVLSDMHCLARDCARDEVFRKFVAPALELIMLDKALRGEFDREEALLNFGEMYATAIAGDGSVGRRLVMLAVGGELGGGAALLRLATLHMLNQLLPEHLPEDSKSDGLKFGVRMYTVEGKYYIVATGGDATKLNRLLAVSAPSARGGYLSPKFNEFVKEARVEVQLDKNSIRLTERGRVAASLTISEVGIAVKYNVYLQENAIELRFRSADRSRAELAARLLRLAGVGAEVKKESGRDEWYVVATTDKLAAGRKELRDALAEIVKAVRNNGWVDADKAGRWLEKLESGLTLREDWPKYHVGLDHHNSLEVRYGSTNPESIKQVAEQLRATGLVEKTHFTAKMPYGGKRGYVRILREGLAYAAWLSVHGSGDQQRLAAELVEYILQRAREESEDAYRKALEIVEEGKARGSLTLEGFERRVEVDGRKHVVKVIGGGAELEESRRGKKLLRIKIMAEVDGVKGEYVMTYGRYGEINAAMGRAYVRSGAPGGREADAERFTALIEALTGKEPKVYRMNNGTIEIVCGREHLDGFRRYTELADAIEKWLRETE
jgi:hypothetical protein